MNSINYLHPQDIALKLDLSKREVIALIKKGFLPGYRFGEEYRVANEDLSLFIEKSKIEKG